MGEHEGHLNVSLLLPEVPRVHVGLQVAEPNGVVPHGSVLDHPFEGGIVLDRLRCFPPRPSARVRRVYAARPGSRLRRVKPSDDLKRRLAYDDLVRTWAPTPFANGSVPIGPCLEWGSSGFVEGIVRLSPEFSGDAARMKWDSTSYVYAGTIFVRPAFMGWRTARQSSPRAPAMVHFERNGSSGRPPTTRSSPSTRRSLANR